MKKFIPILLFVVFFVSCSSKNNVPRGILSHEEMQAVLWDLLRADEFLAVYVLPKDSTLNKNVESAKMYEQIFRMHKCTKEKFQQSLLFYQSHPSVFKVMLDSLHRRQNSLDSIQNKFRKGDTSNHNVKVMPIE